MPKNFPIPKFRTNTLDNFKQQVLTDSDRKYVVQTLATMLMTYVQKPSLNDCGIIAKSLLHEYPFLKDDTGSEGEDGEVQCVLNLMCDDIHCTLLCTAFLEVVYLLSLSEHQSKPGQISPRCKEET